LSNKVRRSWLLVPLTKEAGLLSAGRSGADVVVLDLVELVREEDKPAARELVVAAIATVGAGGAKAPAVGPVEVPALSSIEVPALSPVEVFAQVDPELLYADLRACVWPGLRGVVVARLESARQVAEADALLGQLEEERGIAPHTLEIVASLETARGNQDAYNIATASRRIWGLTLGRADLVMDLRPEPSGEVHLMQYLMQRLITVANAAGAVPLGAWWRAPDRGLLATPENTYQAALRGRAIGFKGSLCLRGNQVESLNRGFTPTQAEVQEARRLLESYNAGVAQWVAVIREGDRIIDRGAATQARRLIDWATACAARDQAKSAAAEQLSAP